MADILVNATRRAFVGNLGKNGWREIPRLMINQKKNNVQVISLGSSVAKYERRPYLAVLRDFDTIGSKTMLAPRFLRQTRGT
jgi:hypothetical protein